ncbi:MAG: iron-containing redox enzyme family protein [Sphingomicrobium sp.]|nr:iron-containing redox enzyme family protein [Sphingomonadales bacterium]
MSQNISSELSSEAVFCDAFQRRLARWNRDRLAPAFPTEAAGSNEGLPAEMLVLESIFLTALRLDVASAAMAAPTDADAFVSWFDELRVSGPGQQDTLFPWLAEQASFDDLRWFFEQEAAGEAGFDDLVAMTQVKMPIRAKLELARNYWDEMGRGNAKGMHGPMLGLLGTALGVSPTIDGTVWESLALANAMTAMATRREFAWHSIGALGVIELTAPDRARLVSDGLRRVGVSGKDRHYFDLHAVLDVKHSEAWNREVIGPLVADDPARARFIAEGALIRLTCGERCYDRYRQMLWGAAAPAKPVAQAA